jgi:trehalose/maltose hydrolase-like predicted phosphorylase
MTYRVKPGLTLREAVEEEAERFDVMDIADPHERAALIAENVYRNFPLAWKLKSIQDMAARACGVGTQRELERDSKPEKIKKEEETYPFLDAAMKMGAIGALLVPFYDKAWMLLLSAGGFYLIHKLT